MDLLVEYNLDVFDKDPLEVHRQADGEIQLTDTGDSLIDKWERQIAAGEEPDLTESFTPESLEKIKGLNKRTKNSGGMTMKETWERIQKHAKLQEVDSPSSGIRIPNEFNTFGD